MTELLSSIHSQPKVGKADSKLNFALSSVLMEFGSNSQVVFFRHTKDKAVLTRYFGYWFELLQYTTRCRQMAGSWDVHHKIPPPPGGQPVMSTIQEVREFSRALLLQPLEGNHFNSPIPGFVAMWTMDPASGMLRSTNNISSMVAGLIWVAQLLLLDLVWEMEEVDDNRQVDLLKGLMSRWLNNQRPSAMGTLLALNLLLRSVSKDEIVNYGAYWHQEDTLIYKGLCLRMDEIKGIYSRGLGDLGEMLSRMTKGCKLPELSTTMLSDSLEHDKVGGSFATDRANEEVMGKSEEQKKKQLLVSWLGRQPGMVSYRPWAASPGVGVGWLHEAVVEFEGWCQKFLKLMAAMVHISSGGPLRGTELLQVTWRNPASRLRSLVVIKGHFCIITHYHKSQATSLRQKTNMRFLPLALGDLLLKFLTYCQPVREDMQWSTGGKAMSLTPRLFSRFSGEDWPEDSLRDSLKKACLDSGMLEGVNLQQWRQVVTAVIKKYFVNSDSMLDEEEENSDFNQVGQGLMLQSNHSVRTASMCYTNQAIYKNANLWDGLVHTSFQNSQSWQVFLCGQEPSVEGVPLPLRIKPKSSFTEQQVRELAFRCYLPGSPVRTGGAFRWTSELQGQLAQALCSNLHSQVLAVMPTGGGKSLLYMLPAFVPGSGVTVVVVPLVALKVDVLRRCNEQHALTAAEWHPGAAALAGDSVKVLVASVETAASQPFRNHMHILQKEGRLERIVLDECHLVLTSSHYRSGMMHLKRLMPVGANMLLLTATLPPSWEMELQTALLMDNLKIFRLPTGRRELVYRLERVGSTSASLSTTSTTITTKKQKKAISGFLQQCLARFEQEWSKAKVNSWDRAMVITKYIKDAEALSGEMGWPVVLSSSSPEERSEAIRSWMGWKAGGGDGVICGTTAIGTGIDYPHVRLVVHVGEPWGLIDFAQESGRAGRDGKVATSLVLIPEGWRPVINNRGSSAWGSSCKDANLTALENMLVDEGGCVRAHLSGFLDGSAVSCEEMGEGVELCCRCSKKSSEDSNSVQEDFQDFDMVDEAGQQQAVIPVTPSSTTRVVTGGAGWIPQSAQGSIIRETPLSTTTAGPSTTTRSVRSTGKRPAATSPAAAVLGRRSFGGVSKPGVTGGGYIPTSSQLQMAYREALGLSSSSTAVAAAGATPDIRTREQYLNKLHPYIGKCAICLVAGGGLSGEAEAAGADHSLEQCTSFIQFCTDKRKTQLQAGTGCYFCYQPRSICGGRPCTYKDILIPAVWSLWHHHRSLVVQVCSTEGWWSEAAAAADVDQFLVWACQPASFAGTRTINMVRLFARLC